MPNDKFDFLMCFTKTTNAAFAGAFNYDVSYISKIRSGKRNFPKENGFLQSMSVFFAEQMGEESVRGAASTIINHGGEWPEDTEEAAAVIREWVGSGDVQLTDLLRAYLETRDSAMNHAEICPAPEKRPEASGNQEKAQQVQLFYGNSGKREALIHSFASLCNNPKPYKLLIYSDESITWFMEDRDYFETWKNYCLRLIEYGSTITVINYLGREQEEMWEGLKMWIPLVLTGAVKAYHCNRTSNKLFSRTLAVAEGELALTSNSLFLNDSHTVTTLYTGKEAVDALTNELYAYLPMCVPTCVAYPDADAPELRERLESFDKVKSDLYYVGASPSVFSVENDLKEGRKVYEILFLPDKKALINGQVPVCMARLYGYGSRCIAPEDYICLLQNLLDLSDEFSNLHVIVSPFYRPDYDFTLIYRPENGFFIGTASPEERVFYSDIPPVVASMSKVLDSAVSKTDMGRLNRMMIKNYISEIKHTLERKEKSP